MPLGEEIKVGTKSVGSGSISTGSVKSDWSLVNDDLSSANTDALLDLSDSGDNTNARTVIVPHGATRVRVRIACSEDADTFTTDPVVRIVGVDAQGVPFRIDAEENDATGQTLALDDSTAFAAKSMFWSQAYGGIGWDVYGAERIYILVETEGAYLESATPVTIECWAQFLN